MTRKTLNISAEKGFAVFAQLRLNLSPVLDFGDDDVAKELVREERAKLGEHRFYRHTARSLHQAQSSTLPWWFDVAYAVGNDWRVCQALEISHAAQAP